MRNGAHGMISRSLGSLFAGRTTVVRMLVLRDEVDSPFTQSGGSDRTIVGADVCDVEACGSLKGRKGVSPITGILSEHSSIRVHLGMRGKPSRVLLRQGSWSRLECMLGAPRRCCVSLRLIQLALLHCDEARE